MAAKLSNEGIENIKNNEDPSGLAKEYISDIAAEIFEVILKQDHTVSFEEWLNELKPSLQLNLLTFIDELAKVFENEHEGVFNFLRVNLKKHNLEKLPINARNPALVEMKTNQMMMMLQKQYQAAKDQYSSDKPANKEDKEMDDGPPPLVP